MKKTWPCYQYQGVINYSMPIYKCSDFSYWIWILNLLQAFLLWVDTPCLTLNITLFFFPLRSWSRIHEIISLRQKLSNDWFQVLQHYYYFTIPFQNFIHALCRASIHPVDSLIQNDVQYYYLIRKGEKDLLDNPSCLLMGLCDRWQRLCRVGEYTKYLSKIYFCWHNPHKALMIFIFLEPENFAAMCLFRRCLEGQKISFLCYISTAPYQDKPQEWGCISVACAICPCAFLWLHLRLI